MSERDAVAWYSRTMALAALGVVATIGLGVVGLAFMSAGVIPQLLPDPDGFRVEYQVNAVGVVGILSIVLAGVAAGWTLVAARSHYRKGIAAQAEVD